MSVVIADEAPGPQVLLDNHDGYGIASFTTACARLTVIDGCPRPCQVRPGMRSSSGRKLTV
jgi:hypothetical protein